MPPLSKKDAKAYKKFCEEQETRIHVGDDIMLVKNHDVDFLGTEKWDVYLRNQKSGHFSSVQMLDAGNIKRMLGVEVPSFGNIY